MFWGNADGHMALITSDEDPSVMLNSWAFKAHGKLSHCCCKRLKTFIISKEKKWAAYIHVITFLNETSLDRSCPDYYLNTKKDLHGISRTQLRQAVNLTALVTDFWWSMCCIVSCFCSHDPAHKERLVQLQPTFNSLQSLDPCSQMIRDWLKRLQHTC